MSTVTCVSPSPIIGSLRLPNRHSHLNRIGNPSHQRQITAIKHKSSFLKTHGMRPAPFNTTTCWKLYAAMGNQTPPPVPNLPKSNVPSWARCIVGIIVSLLQPFWKLSGGGKLLAFARQVEQTVDIVEHVAEVVEHVAEAVEKASSEIVKTLPEDGLFKEAVTVIECVSKEVAHDAEDAIEFINKVEEAKEELESIVEDVIEGNFEDKESDKDSGQEKEQMKVDPTTQEDDTKTKTKEEKMEIDQGSLGGNETPDR